MYTDAITYLDQAKVTEKAPDVSFKSAYLYRLDNSTCEK